ncbi:hypothetical protein DL93DRAFT_2077711 [Clavulina sp. PMI_390]|nr:hypothetical protein DL93DRAFT_2077711 [Clavulina sp. PMI_390]
MNGVRLIARELQRSDSKQNSRLSLTYCLYLESLLDFLDDNVVFLPAWGTCSSRSICASPIYRH